MHEIDFENRNPPTILLVEDDDSDQVLIKKQIKSLWPDCNIVLVDSLQTAYKAFKAQNFDMIVLDLNLPDAMGPNTVGEMRRFNRSTPIIVLTGMLTSLTANEALRQGANNIYAKSQIMHSDFLNILEQNMAS